MSNYKKYCVGFVFSLICLGFIIFDFEGYDRVKQYNPYGIAHYLLPYDLLQPTPRLFKIIYINAIKKFSRRDTVVFIGNSVIAGSGAKDSTFFDKQVAKRFNVLNAGLGGEYFPASLALATIGIKAVAQKLPGRFFHIVIAYPATRLYLFSNASGYWVTGPALLSLAKEYNLDGYLFQGDGLHPMSEFTQLQDDVKNYAVINMRCVVDKRVVMKMFQDFTPYCLQAISAERIGIDVPTVFNAPSVVQSMRSEVGHFSKAPTREELLKFMSNKVAYLTRFLNKNHIRYKIYFLLLGDPPGAVMVLPKNVRQRYYKARYDFIKDIHSRMHGWVVKNIDSFTTSDFHDAVHMNEKGQEKLALKILHLIGS